MKNVKLSDVISNSNQLLVLQVNECESIEKKTRQNVKHCKKINEHTHLCCVFLWSGKRHFLVVFTTTN